MNELRSTGIKVCLFLTFTGVMLAMGIDWLTIQVLSQSHVPNIQLHADQLPDVQFNVTLTISAISAKVDADDQLAEIKVWVDHASLQELDFELPLANAAQIERSLSRDLGLPPDQVQQLIRYHTTD